MRRQHPRHRTARHRSCICRHQEVIDKTRGQAVQFRHLLRKGGFQLVPALAPGHLQVVGIAEAGDVRDVPQLDHQMVGAGRQIQGQMILAGPDRPHLVMHQDRFAIEPHHDGIVAAKIHRDGNRLRHRDRPVEIDDAAVGQVEGDWNPVRPFGMGGPGGGPLGDSHFILRQRCGEGIAGAGGRHPPGGPGHELAGPRHLLPGGAGGDQGFGQGRFLLEKLRDNQGANAFLGRRPDFPDRGPGFAIGGNLDIEIHRTAVGQVATAIAGNDDPVDRGRFRQADLAPSRGFAADPAVPIGVQAIVQPFDPMAVVSRQAGRGAGHRAGRLERQVSGRVRTVDLQLVDAGFAARRLENGDPHKPGLCRDKGEGIGMKGINGAERNRTVRFGRQGRHPGQHRGGQHRQRQQTLNRQQAAD